MTAINYNTLTKIEKLIDKVDKDFVNSFENEEEIKLG